MVQGGCRSHRHAAGPLLAALVWCFCTPLARGEVWAIQGLGLVNGTQTGRVHTFYGIRYGVQKRFEQATPEGSWRGVRDATRRGKSCIQQNGDVTPGDMSEDCLTLDVRSCSNATLKPVMVFIHGGALATGSSDEGGLYNGSTLVEHADCGVVYASLQYRLNLFGFFDAKGLPGKANFGLYDQQLALKWVQSHIRDFGGDPKQVTLFGQSAGAASVAIHMASPGSRGLFAAAIAESPWTSSQTGNKPRSLAQLYGQDCVAQACPEPGAGGLLACLQGFNVTALLAFSSCKGYPPFVTVDGELLTQSVWKSARQGSLAAVPLIAGGQPGEWSLFSYFFGFLYKPHQKSMTISLNVS